MNFNSDRVKSSCELHLFTLGNANLKGINCFFAAIVQTKRTHEEAPFAHEIKKGTLLAHRKLSRLQRRLEHWRRCSGYLRNRRISLGDIDPKCILRWGYDTLDRC